MWRVVVVVGGRPRSARHRFRMRQKRRRLRMGRKRRRFRMRRQAAPQAPGRIPSARHWTSARACCASSRRSRRHASYGGNVASECRPPSGCGTPGSVRYRCSSCSGRARLRPERRSRADRRVLCPRSRHHLAAVDRARPRLGGSVWSSDRDRAFGVAARINCGIAAIYNAFLERALTRGWSSVGRIRSPPGLRIPRHRAATSS